jgi:hypothetical protein
MPRSQSNSALLLHDSTALNDDPEGKFKTLIDVSSRYAAFPSAAEAVLAKIAGPREWRPDCLLPMPRSAGGAALLLNDSVERSDEPGAKNDDSFML